MGKLAVLFASLALLAGCASRSHDIIWPDGAYPRGYFEAAWQEDDMAQQYQSQDEYLYWVTQFYTGTSLAPGWLNLTSQVLERIDVSRRVAVSDRLFELGGRIGSEWAKHNAVRRLNTRNAAVWRDALIESIEHGELDMYMNRVASDVERLLAGDLQKDDIYFERYYIDEYDF